MLFLTFTLILSLGCVAHQNVKEEAVENVSTDVPNTPSKIEINKSNENNMTESLCNITKITNDHNKKVNLNMWENKIVWETKEGSNYHLFLYDALKNKTKELEMYLSSKERDIFDEYLLFRTDFDIKIFDMVTNKSEVIPSRSASTPKLSENILCYSDRVGSYKIFCLNLSENQCKHEIKDNPNSILSLDVFKNNLAWISSINNQTMVKYYNLSNKTAEKTEACYDRPTDYGVICFLSCYYTFNKDDIHTIKKGNNMKNVMVYKNIIAWQERDNNWNIYYHDLSTNKTVRITSDKSADINPWVSSYYIVWQKLENNQWDIYAYNIHNKKIIQVTNSKTNETNPVVFWRRIAWIQDNDIYTCAI